MKTMKYYHDLYLKCDVLLLVDVFEKFRNNSLKNCKLHQSYYLSTPGLSWDAMLKMTKIELELIPDPEMYILFEKGTRGGISYISNRFSKANNNYSKFYDPKQESKHIIYIMYYIYVLYTLCIIYYIYCSYAMSKFPPTNGFK